MRLVILGVCGTFMAGVAQIAQQMGHTVHGYDTNCYPPMSDQLAQSRISIDRYADFDLDPSVIDWVLVGNAISRGHPVLEFCLNHNVRVISAPEWLRRNLLDHKRVIAIAGTHGKTTTTTMVTTILRHCGVDPGYLIAGEPIGLPSSACWTKSDWFVIEADEYDTAYLDKRSKMVHYKSEILLINNLEFDHADIFDSLTDIEWQFHQTIRTMAQNAHVIHLSSCAAIRAVLQRGCWSKTSSFGLDDHSDWQLCRKPSIAQADEFRTPEGTYINCPPSLIGQHNALNGLAAVAIAQHVGVVAEQAVDALTQYQGVRRRLEYLGTLAKRPFYSDFAHHPTAISCIIDTLNQRHPGARIGVLMELGSHTQRRADMVQAHRLALQSVAFVLLLQPEGMVLTDHGLHPNGQVFASKKHLLDSIQQDVYACDIWLLLSSRSLGGALDGLSFDVPSCVDSADILD